MPVLAEDARVRLANDLEHLGASGCPSDTACGSTHVPSDSAMAVAAHVVVHREIGIWLVKTRMPPASSLVCLMSSRSSAENSCLKSTFGSSRLGVMANLNYLVRHHVNDAGEGPGLDQRCAARADASTDAPTALPSWTRRHGRWPMRAGAMPYGSLRREVGWWSLAKMRAAEMPSGMHTTAAGPKVAPKASVHCQISSWCHAIITRCNK